MSETQSRQKKTEAGSRFPWLGLGFGVFMLPQVASPFVCEHFCGKFSAQTASGPTDLETVRVSGVNVFRVEANLAELSRIVYPGHGLENGKLLMSDEEHSTSSLALMFKVYSIYRSRESNPQPPG